MAFGFGWTPCIGPILGSILALASLENTLIQGIFLLITYSIGLGIPFVLSGYYMGNFLIFSKKARKSISNIQKISGLILIVTGILILTSPFFNFTLMNFGIWKDENTFSSMATLGLLFFMRLLANRNGCALNSWVSWPQFENNCSMELILFELLFSISKLSLWKIPNLVNFKIKILSK